MSQETRMEFIEERDGVDAACKFAEQLMATYIMEALRHNPQLAHSVAVAKKYLEKNGRVVKIVVVGDK